MKCKVKKVLLMYSVIVMTLVISNTKSYAKEVEQLRVVSDEEYSAFRQNEAEQENSIEPMSEENDDGMQSIYDLMKDQPEIPEEYINDDNLAYDYMTPINEVSTMTIPESTVVPYILNSESLKNGMLTTETQIAWVCTFSDEDGNELLDFECGGFPRAYIINRYSDGFITQFRDPGEYTVLYRAIDSGYEYSEPTGYRISVAPVEDYEVIEDELASKDEVKTYDINLDFSQTDVFGVCLVKMGEPYVKADIKDADGNIVKTLNTAMNRARKVWYFVEKPSTDAGIVPYTIDVYNKGSEDVPCKFRVITGKKEDMEAMLGGPENATQLQWYTEEDQCFLQTNYTPNKDEYWFRYTAQNSMATFTFLTDHPELRFKVLDIDDLYILFDSNAQGNEGIHKSKFCGPFAYAEKVKLSGMTAGKDYYVVLYCPNEFTTQDFVEDTINSAVGLPHMISGLSETLNASNDVTATSSSFSSDAIIVVGDNGDTIPNTACVEEIDYGGTRVSNIAYWRAKYPSSSTWKESAKYDYRIKFDYVPDSSSNINANGTWRIGFKANLSNVTFRPSMKVQYKYELGD